MKIALTFLISFTAASLLMAEGDGETLYKNKCASCHGLDGEKKALGTSGPINNLTNQEIVDALVSFKDGSYNGKFKSVKRSLMNKLSEDDIPVVSAYMQTLGT